MSFYLSAVVTKFLHKREKTQKERKNLFENEYFFVKTRKNDTQLHALFAGLLCVKPIFGPKTGVKLGLIGFVFASFEEVKIAVMACHKEVYVHWVI
jgi:hypothetical protein